MESTRLKPLRRRNSTTTSMNTSGSEVFLYSKAKPSAVFSNTAPL